MNKIKNAIGCVIVAIGSGILISGMNMIDDLSIQKKFVDILEESGFAFNPTKLNKPLGKPHYITQACPFCGTNISVSTRTQQIPAHFDLRKTPCAVSGWNIEEAKELAKATSK